MANPITVDGRDRAIPRRCARQSVREELLAIIIGPWNSP
jgi:hypothetical protein